MGKTNSKRIFRAEEDRENVKFYEVSNRSKRSNKVAKSFRCCDQYPKCLCAQEDY